MKSCPNCHHDNNDLNKYCTVCGTELRHEPASPSKEVKGNHDNNNNQKKNGMKWSAGALLLLCICLGAFFILNSRADQNHSRNYQETIAMAEKYLQQLNYSKAEEYFLEAREIDPKNPEPYEELYRI